MKSNLIYGLFCSVVVLIIAILLNLIFPIDKMIAGAVSLIGAVLPTIVDKVSQKKIETCNELTIKELKYIEKTLAELTIKIDELEDKFNQNENDIIAIQSILGCFNISQIYQDVSSLKNKNL